MTSGNLDPGATSDYKTAFPKSNVWENRVAENLGSIIFNNMTKIL